MNRRGFFGACVAVAAAVKALPTLANLEPVGPFAFEEQCGPPYPYYRTCDFCYEGAHHDIWAGLFDESEWRRFYIARSECDLTVCEHCIPAYLAGDV